MSRNSDTCFGYHVMAPALLSAIHSYCDRLSSCSLRFRPVLRCYHIAGTAISAMQTELFHQSSIENQLTGYSGDGVERRIITLMSCQ